MANRFIDPFPHFINNDGSPLVDGTLEFYLTGTATPQATYQNQALSTPNLAVIELDARGMSPTEVWLDPNVIYKVILRDSDGTAIRTYDPVNDHAANVTAAFQVWSGDPNGDVAGNAGVVGGIGASVIFDTLNGVIWVCTTTGDETTAVWEEQGATLSGAVQFTGVLSPAALATDEDDYNPTNFSTASVLRQNSSADVAITGFAGGASGRWFTYYNVSTAYRHTIRRENSGSAAANRVAMDADLILWPGQSMSFLYDTPSARWRPAGAFNNLPVGEPGGRLTLVSATPVMVTDQTAKTTVYYTPYKHNLCRLYNGTHWYVAPFNEMSQTLADATKSPLAAAVNSIYDMFLWNDEGTGRCTRGPTWATGGGTATTRGAGAGSTELEMVDGVLVNKFDITNGPAARRGVYVGTIATDGNGANGQLNMMLAPAAAAGGTNNRLDVWNMYSRVYITSICRDSTDSWTYTTATIRAANNSNSNRITAVFGQSEDACRASYRAQALGSSTNTNAKCGVGRDSTTVFDGFPFNLGTGASADGDSMPSADSGQPAGLGQHYFQALEWSQVAGTMTWYGDKGQPTLTQTGITLETKM